MNNDPYTINFDNATIVASSTGDFSSAFLSSTGTLSCSAYFQSFIQCEYSPQPDITAYELAQILPYLIGRAMHESDWEKLGVATRHLKRL